MRQYAKKIRLACIVDGCESLRTGHGYCGKHYQRFRKYGDPLHVKPNLGNRTARPVLTERTCRSCGRTGALGEFVHARNTCKPCARQKLKAWQSANPDKVAVIRAREKSSEVRRLTNLRARAAGLGLDVEAVVAYYEAHDGRCEICGNPPRKGGRDLNMDHDHATGAFRGMLCDNCNAGLGRFKDDPVRMESAISYLKRSVS